MTFILCHYNNVRKILSTQTNSITQRASSISPTNTTQKSSRCCRQWVGITSLFYPSLSSIAFSNNTLPIFPMPAELWLFVSSDSTTGWKCVICTRSCHFPRYDTHQGVIITKMKLPLLITNIVLQLKNGNSIMAFTFLEKNCQLTTGAAGYRGGKRTANEFWETENTIQILYVSPV